VTDFPSADYRSKINCEKPEEGFRTNCLGGFSVSIKNNEPLIAFTTLERGMTRDEMKQRLIQALQNKGFVVKGADKSTKSVGKSGRYSESTK
jgi:hypothetical protein